MLLDRETPPAELSAEAGLCARPLTSCPPWVRPARPRRASLPRPAPLPAAAKSAPSGSARPCLSRVLLGCSDAAVYTLYRNSVVMEGVRLHVATFDAAD